MCTGRIDLSFILRAFSNGMDGVFIGGCHPGECHYITEGNYMALSLVQLTGRLLQYIGINPDRITLEWISAAEGIRFAEVVNDFCEKIRESGPLSMDGDNFAKRLEAVKNLVPYIRLVERERLRVPGKSTEDIMTFYNSPEFEKLFRELIEDKLRISEITALLKETPRSSDDIAGAMSMTPSEVSRYVGLSTRHGLIRYDADEKVYAAA